MSGLSVLVESLVPINPAEEFGMLAFRYGAIIIVVVVVVALGVSYWRKKKQKETKT